MGARIGAATIITALATPALADGVLPFDGVYGNPNGCHLFATGEMLSDDYVILTPDTFGSKRIGCDFVALVSSDRVASLVDAVCSPGGRREVTVSDIGQNAKSIRLDDTTFVGPLAPCPNLSTNPGASELSL
jgi:hypothetical protein